MNPKRSLDWSGWSNGPHSGNRAVVVFLRWLQVETHRRWRWVMAATVVVSGVFTIGHIVNVWAG